MLNDGAETVKELWTVSVHSFLAIMRKQGELF